MNKLIIFLLSTFVHFQTRAQEVEKIDNIFQGTRFVNSHSANLAEKGELQLLIQHRFGDISGGAYEFFGLDQASMRLGFEYGFSNNFNFGIGRSTYLKTFDAFGKFRFIQQTANFPITITATVEGSVPTLRNYFPNEFDKFSDKFSGNAQLHLSSTIKSIGFQLSPGYLNTGYLLTEDESISTFIMGFGGSVKFSEKVSANIEYMHDFSDDLINKNPLSVGVDLDTGGHLFQLVLTNSQGMFTQALFTNAQGDWAKGSLFFGFNLIREFDINKPIEF